MSEQNRTESAPAGGGSASPTGDQAAIQQPGGTGAASSPLAGEGERPGADATDRAEPGAPPPGTNQGKNEPVPATPDRPARESGVGAGHPQHPGQGPGTPSADQGPDAPTDEHRAAAAAGSASRAPGQEGTPPRSTDTDDEAAATRSRPGSPPESVSGGVPSPGGLRGTSAPAVQAAAGTSETSEPVQGIKRPTNAPVGKPDGEVDTRA